MPTYSYRCNKCENVFDSFHSMSCNDPQYCPKCGGVGTKLLSASSIIFKGHGFYSTDYRDSGYLEAQKKDSKPADAPKSESKTTAKPAEKAATASSTTSSATSTSSSTSNGDKK